MNFVSMSSLSLRTAKNQILSSDIKKDVVHLLRNINDNQKAIQYKRIYILISKILLSNTVVSRKPTSIILKFSLHLYINETYICLDI